MYKRSISAILGRFASIYPAVGITGPRQSGKTTLARETFPHLPYVSLENLDRRLQAKNDPRGFLSLYPEGAIFDEVQHVPELLSYLQQILDETPLKGRYVLTGSENFALSQSIAQSLAGRIGMLTLLPLSIKELNIKQGLNSYIFKGGYPALHDRGMHPLEFYPAYIQTYVERDLREFINIDNLGRFQNFLKLCAARVGQVINFSSLATDAGISHTTARVWLNILEASYLIFFLQPFHRNFSKRLIKMPKLYFYDTGLAASLLGLEKEEQLETHFLKGALSENLIILEVLKMRLNRGLPSNLYFWRDHAGHEIDLLGEWGGHLHSMEIKSSQTFHPDSIKHLDYFSALTDESKSYLIHAGEPGLYKEVKIIPFEKISDSFA